MGRRCGLRFVAVYVDPSTGVPTLQVGSVRYPLDGGTAVQHEQRLRGLASRLIVTRAGSAHTVVQQLVIAGALLRRVDPAYDDLDAASDDFLADVADLAASDHRQAWFLEVKDANAGPSGVV